MADPWQGSRTMGVLIVGTLFGAATAGIWANTDADLRLQNLSNRLYSAANHEAYYPNDDSFYAHGFVLVGIAIQVAVVIAALGLLASLADSIVSRRRTYAALVATGIPRSVLARTVVWQTFVVALPAILIAAAAGELLPRLLMGTSMNQDSQEVSPGVSIPALHVSVDVPWPQLGLVVGGSLVAIAITVGIGLLFLKPSTSIEELRTA
jgi:ABC-type antimicrobial peptide transport system permease subunit